ncbi:MAG: DUF732 domain-containing protein [Actinomycetota bacterium]
MTIPATMPPYKRSLLVACLAAALVACGSGRSPDTGRVQFLLLAHQPLAGSLSSATDSTLVELGQRACSSMDAHVRSDQIVAQIGGNPEPGSAEFNAYSFIVVDAALHLCPQHKAEFSSTDTLQQ